MSLPLGHSAEQATRRDTDRPPRGDLDMPTIITADISPEGMTHRAVTCYLLPPDDLDMPMWTATAR